DGTRARRSQQELVGGNADAQAALSALVRSRLLVAREREDGTSYELAHEALIRGWDTLRKWLDETVSSRAGRKRFGVAAAEGDRLGRRAEALWSARQLEEVVGIDREALPQREQEFLKASKRRVRRNQAMVYAAVLAIPLVIIGIRAKVRYDSEREVRLKVEAH